MNVIETKNLTKYYGKIRGVDNLTRFTPAIYLLAELLEQ